MPEITAIEQQKKKKHWYSIFVDKEYAFSLPETELALSKLRVGIELTKKQVEEHKKQSQSAKNYDMTLRYLGIRPRSEKEIRDYLYRKQIAKDEIEQIITRLLGANLLDDEAFARSWVQYRRRLKSMSRRRLQHELYKKGIDKEIIDMVLPEDSEKEMEALNRLIEKKRRQTRYQDDKKLKQYLARKGFSYELIRQALEN